MIGGRHNFIHVNLVSTLCKEALANVFDTHVLITKGPLYTAAAKKVCLHRR